MKTDKKRTAGNPKWNHVGKRFGSMVITHRAGTNSWGLPLWGVRCDCGAEKVKTSHALAHAKSCGHRCALYSISSTSRSRTHGMIKHPGYRTWIGMKTRCLNANSADYPNYGGRGISIHAPWAYSFETFWSDMGALWKPGLQLDRIDNNGNYEPGNVRWVTPKENSRNKRNSTTPSWALDKLTEHHINPQTFYERISRGWDLLSACTRPVQKHVKHIKTTP